MQRHDLVYLQPSETYELLNTSLPIAVQQAVEQMVIAQQPFTVCRQTMPYKTKLATSCLVNGQKYRVAVSIDSIPQVVKPPLTLEMVLPLLANSVLISLRTFGQVCKRLGCEVFVYGSFSQQAMTGLPFISPNSDLDLLLVIQDEENLAKTLTAIQQITLNLHTFKLDGEIRFNKHDIAFNELILALSHDIPSVLIKTLYDVELKSITEIFGTQINALRTAIMGKIA